LRRASFIHLICSVLVLHRSDQAITFARACHWLRLIEQGLSRKLPIIPTSGRNQTILTSGNYTDVEPPLPIYRYCDDYHFVLGSSELNNRVLKHKWGSDVVHERPGHMHWTGNGKVWEGCSLVIATAFSIQTDQLAKRGSGNKKSEDKNNKRNIVVDIHFTQKRRVLAVKWHDN
jgi:hypothetical protein